MRVPPRRDQRDHRDRRRPRLGDQCRAAACGCGTGARRAACRSSMPPRRRPTATARSGSRTTARSPIWRGCARSTCMAGPSTPSICASRACSAAGAPRPPQWAGLKFFNVYGPNEYHKGAMVSVVKVKHDEVAAGQPPRLFRSDRPGIADGEQRRDFIWVGDVVDVMLWLLDTPAASGLFNVGTGRARSYLDLAHAVCDAAGVARRIEFIDMPDTAARPVPVLHRGQHRAPARRRLCGPVHPAGGRRPPLRAGLSRAADPYR